MKRTPAPLILLLVVIAGWGSARTTFLTWSDVLDNSPAPPPLPGIFVPLDGPLVFSQRVLAHPNEPIAVSSERSASRLALPEPQDFQSQTIDQAVNIGSVGGGSQFVAVQQMLLARMIRPRLGHVTAMMNSPGIAGTTLRGDAASMYLGLPHRVEPVPTAGRTSRWSASSWLFARDGRSARTLAEHSMLGGTQAGARLAYRLDRDGRVHAFARLSATPTGRGSIEGAAGIAMRPLQSVPVDVVVERRERLSGVDARSAFAAFATAGVSDRRIVDSFRLDAYAAAGVVGFRQRDLFAEGSTRIARDVGTVGPVRVSLGGGAWAAAQPDASRLDVGPTLVTRLTRSGTVSPRLSIDYRNRIAGDAAPVSGVAIALSADF